MATLTGKTRHRISWFGKVYVQVEYWQRSATISSHYAQYWRDATAQDMVDIAEGRISIEAPYPPMPKVKTPKPEINLDMDVCEPDKFVSDQYRYSVSAFLHGGKL